MSLCRLSDPSKESQNLTLKTLVEKCASVTGLGDQCKAFQDACDPFRQHQNKRIGHAVFRTTVNPPKRYLPIIDISNNVNDAVFRAEGILRTVFRRYQPDGEILDFSDPHDIGGADCLMGWLKGAWESHLEALRRHLDLPDSWADPPS
jgi:hypothetical protein